MSLADQLYAYNSAIKLGFNADAAMVAEAIQMQEGGGWGDSGQSAGPFQFYGGGGQLNNFLSWLQGVLPQKMWNLQSAGDYANANPNTAIDWALTGYIGDALKAGQAAGLSGNNLVAYVIKNAQNPNADPQPYIDKFQQLVGTIPPLPAPASPDVIGPQSPGVTTTPKGAFNWQDPSTWGNLFGNVGDSLGAVGTAMGKGFSGTIGAVSSITKPITDFTSYAAAWSAWLADPHLTLRFLLGIIGLGMVGLGVVFFGLSLLPQGTTGAAIKTAEVMA